MKTNQALQDKLSTEIKELKIKKFNQDKKDMAEDKVYIWRNPDKVLLLLSMADAGGMPLTSIHPRLTNALQPAPHRLPVVVFYSTRDWTGGGGRRHAHRRDGGTEGRRRPQARAS